MKIEEFEWLLRYKKSSILLSKVWGFLFIKIIFSMDYSMLDKKYFIDATVHNCPFCKRNNVPYQIKSNFVFNWSPDKQCLVIKTACGSCWNEWLHLTFNIDSLSYYQYDWYRFKSTIEDIDWILFYNQPTSFFSLDSNINQKIRELLTEADWCIKINYLVWASACLRKAIYELIHIEGVVIFRENWLPKYDESIKNLKSKFPKVEGELFDALAWIQELTCDNIHENSWKGWNTKQLNELILLVKEILYEMYVLPSQRKERFSAIWLLKNKIKWAENK